VTRPIHTKKNPDTTSGHGQPAPHRPDLQSTLNSTEKTEETPRTAAKCLTLTIDIFQQPPLPPL